MQFLFTFIFFRLLKSRLRDLSCIREGVAVWEKEKKTGERKKSTVKRWNRRGQSQLCHGASRKVLGWIRCDESWWIVFVLCGLESNETSWNLKYFIGVKLVGSYDVFLGIFLWGLMGFLQEIWWKFLRFFWKFKRYSKKVMDNFKIFFGN